MLLGISMVDQQNYVDPEFYTGNGQSFETMWTVHGPTYYAARFPIMFVNTASQQVAPGLLGYVLLRFIVFLMAALPLYLLARRMFGVQVAVVSSAFLVLNPLFPRILNWDLTTFLSIPAALAGIALWYAFPRTWSLAIVAAGFLFSVSVNSHVFTGTAIGIFLAVELVFAAFRPRGLRAYAGRLAGLGLGALIRFGLGAVFYLAALGERSTEALLGVTTNAISAGRLYAETHDVPLADYYATNYEMYVPLLTTAAAAVLNRHRLFSNTREARIIWFAVSVRARLPGRGVRA